MGIEEKLKSFERKNSRLTKIMEGAVYSTMGAFGSGFMLSPLVWMINPDISSQNYRLSVSVILVCGAVAGYFLGRYLYTPNIGIPYKPTPPLNSANVSE